MEHFIDYLSVVLILTAIVINMTWPISIPAIIFFALKKRKNNKKFKSTLINNEDYLNNLKSGKYCDVKPFELSAFDIRDIDKLKSFLFDIFVKFENAYNNLDYNAMYNLSSKKIFNMYYSSIECNSKSDEKRIIKDIEKNRMIIYKVSSSEERQMIFTMVEVSYINFVQNMNGKIISGSPTKKIKESFEITFLKSYGDKDLFRCPNCGANLKGTTCEYCNSKVNNCEFKIDSIKRIEINNNKEH